MTNQSWNEFKESVDSIDQRLNLDQQRFGEIEAAMKEMQRHRESESMRWTEQFGALSQSVEALAKSVQEIKSVQLNMLLMMESNGRGPDHGGDGRTDALRQWLCGTLHLDEYFDIFVDEGFDDVSLLVHLEDEDLVKLNVRKMAHRKKLLNAIQSLRRCFAPKEEQYVANGYQSGRSRRDSLSEDHKALMEKGIGHLVQRLVEENGAAVEETEAFVE